MSKHSLRTDKVCQNCGETVEKRFCSNCGQENTETRRSFGYLVRHFIEDLTHYDGAFWLTLKYLLFRPAYLSKEYVSGKRVSFVPPVRLYIFISFITFLLPYILPEADSSEATNNNVTINADSIGVLQKQIKLYYNNSGDLALQLPNTYRSLAHLDSLEASKPEEEKLSRFNYLLEKKYISLKKYDEVELGDKFFETFSRNFPKALFIYLPVFAFVLWLFHGKKRWLYFDHAIFTLHYFSFLLLAFNLMTLSDQFAFIGDIVAIFQIFLFVLLVLALFVYFFVAHKRMYEESGLVSFFKSGIIYSINLLFFSLCLTALFIISFMGLH